MANTIMSAKNSFAEGLIMDFAPDNTQATCMTSALNATLLTFNGNEMSLQNDMGNGRVETAYLPEGYVPVGTCEFGDIIYVVSYNPLTNQSQIGCFPSPERNISSEELYQHGQGSNALSLSYTDFLETDGYNNVTGTLKNTSVKKVLIDTKKLNPGDKYIIYTDSYSITSNFDKLSDCFSIHEEPEHNTKPKYLKLHVVSIEDSGKITYLDTTTKWYTTGLYQYYLSSLKIGNNGTDLDSYRNLVLSNWSIFNSKVSGKLAILAELEMIDTFSCSYKIDMNENEGKNGIIEEGNIKYKCYKLTLCPDHTSTKNINPSYICITLASFNNNSDNLEFVESLGNILPNTVFYYNSGKKPTLYHNAGSITASNLDGWLYSNNIEVGTFKIPYQQKRMNNNNEYIDEWATILSSSFIYNFTVTPAMNYGRLDHLSVPLTIDFNKIGTGEVSLTAWKYHISGNTAILTYGIEAYPKPNYEVSDITILFYDNLGMVGEYLINDKKSYSGTFTEYFGLNGEGKNSRFNRVSKTEGIIKHKGEEVLLMSSDNPDDYVLDGTKIYINDATTLYSGFLYATKIVVHQKHENDAEADPYTPEYRWFWTNPMFNEYYYSIKDFKELRFELILDGEALFETTPYYQWRQKELNNLNNEFDGYDNWKTYSANVQYIGYGGENNINMYIRAGLLNDYGCFNLHGYDSEGNIGDIKNIKLDIYLGKSEIKYNTSENLYEFSHKEGNVGDAEYLSLIPQENNDGLSIVSEQFAEYIENPLSLIEKGKITDLKSNIKDLFNIYFYGSSESPPPEDGIKYLCYNTSLDKCYYISEYDNQSIPLSMQSLLFNKAYVLGESGGTVLVPVYTPIIDTDRDLDELGIVSIFDPGNPEIKLGFLSAVALNHYGNTFSGAMLQADGNLHFTKSYTGDDKVYKFDGAGKMIDTATAADFLDNIWGNLSPELKTFFPVYFGGYTRDGDKEGVAHFNAVAGSVKNYIPTTGWKYKSSLGTDTTKQNSKITTGAFDIDDGGNISNNNTQRSTSFLGVKYKNGMIVFNNAFLDSLNGQSFILQSISPNLGYDNFAYLLFLLLTNTYHKNKRIEDQQINIKNYVRNGDYTVELIKNVLIQLAPENEDKRNIIMKGIDFNEYVGLVCEAIGLLDTDFGNQPNVNLKLLSYAKNHELKVIINSEPMSFFNSEVEAYIRRNGLLIPISDLAVNKFYVYQNNELIQYSNKTLTFNIDDIKANLRYIFELSSDSNPSLLGIHPESTTIFTNYEKAYNKYANYIEDYVRSITTFAYYYDTELEALNGRIQQINKMFDTFPDSIESISKLEIRIDFEQEGIINSIFNLVNYSHNQYMFGITTHVSIPRKTGTHEKASYCDFTSYRFLDLFEYLNSFIASSSELLRSTFGIKDGTHDSDDSTKESAYSGFARSAMLDTNYLVV